MQLLTNLCLQADNFVMVQFQVRLLSTLQNSIANYMFQTHNVVANALVEVLECYYSLDNFCFFYGHKAGKRVSF